MILTLAPFVAAMIVVAVFMSALVASSREDHMKHLPTDADGHAPR